MVRKSEPDDPHIKPVIDEILAAFERGICVDQFHNNADLIEKGDGFEAYDLHVVSDSFSQETIPRLMPGEIVGLWRNPHNETEISVLRRGGKFLGLISTEAGGFLSKKIDENYQVSAAVSHVTYGTPEKPTFGLVVRIRIYDPPK